ncbi:hypothetical protein [Tumebacillus flagellatus]|nr:hypothetical protein [Tumebacillus flagellatus]
MLTYDDVQKLLHLVDKLIASETETEVNTWYDQAMQVMQARGVMMA